MSRAETARHARLKTLALDWARANGFACAALEVRVPRSGFRADVAAMRDDGGGTAVFECKQSRADFVKDAHDEQRARAQLTALLERRETLQQLLATHCPQLRRGEALWAEFDTWDFAPLEHVTYRRVEKELATLRRRVAAGTKFARMARYRCADHLYLVLEEHLHAEAELPAGWGVLLRRGDALELVRAAPACNSSAPQREALELTIAGKLGRPVLRPPAPALAEQSAFLQFEHSA